MVQQHNCQVYSSTRSECEINVKKKKNCLVDLAESGRMFPSSGTIVLIRV